jgi:diguanylate cyclase (GGDEF)-like protein
MAYVAVLVPLFGIVLPRDGETRWAAVAVAFAVAATTMAMNTFYLRRMFASGGWSEPPAFVVLVQALAATAAIGVANYGLSGGGGFYRPLILVPTLLVAVIGNRPMIWATALSALIALVGSTWAQGVDVAHLPALVLSYGTTWGIMVTMFRMVSTRALSATHLTQGIADAAAITARADRLDDGMQRLLPVIGAWALADRVTVFVLDERSTTMFDHWPVGSEPCPSPPTDLVESARAESGAAVDGGVAVILAETGAPGELLVVVVEGPPRNRFEAVNYHYQLVRMADQFGTLVTRSQRIAHLETLSSTDGLTGLPNRRALEERLDLERSVSLQRSDPLSLVMIDIDDFRLYNDSFGHPAGDELLRRFADALRASVRGADFVARYGGEEFCLLLPATTGEGAAALTHHLRKLLGSQDEDTTPAFSAGIATWDGRESNHQLLMRADSALYAAKEDGKDRSVII